MKTLAQHIFNGHKGSILLPHYYPTTPVEILLARLTATSLLQDTDPNVVQKAKAFIQKTSTTFKKADLDWLQSLSERIKTWEQLYICSTYTNAAGTFLEYKLSFTTKQEVKEAIHCHARFTQNKGIWHFVSQTSPLIRVIGDPVLHEAGIPFPSNPTPEEQQELKRQIEHAKSVLIETSGAGIAANQCASIEYPYRFTIVGVFYDSPEHVSGVDRRYPNTKFPSARIMVNPIITAVSTETQQFNHACLSVPCGNRCAVKSPMEMSVTYQDPMNNMATTDVSVKGIDAVVLWHELTHILDGKTYIDVTLESLSPGDLRQFKSMVAHELKKRSEHHAHLPDLTLPPFYFSVKIDEAGNMRLDTKELASVVLKMTDETLEGVLRQANQLLKKQDGALRQGLERFSIHGGTTHQHQNEYTSRVSKL